MIRRLTLILLALLFTLVLIAMGSLAVAVSLTYPKLPSLASLLDYRPKIPLRVYTFDGVQIGEFGEEKRAFTPIEKVPQLMKQAILAAEDERFYEHGGVDYIGVARAALANIVSGHAQSGASTITMQVARNFFLSSEKTLTRKFNEALLSFKIEHSLSKDQILELYFNQIYLGQRAYGFASAARVYYGKTLDQLSPAQMAMLAGLPKAPSSYNPVVNPARARLRQQYVLRRMHELQFIDDTQYQLALAETPSVKRSQEGFTVHAEFVAEMARQAAFAKYGESAYSQGLRVFTTIMAAQQEVAYASARKGVMDYDIRHGYRGPEGFHAQAAGAQPSNEALDEALADLPTLDGLRAAWVVQASEQSLTVMTRDGQRFDFSGKALQFVARSLSPKLPPAQRLRVGSIVRIVQQGEQWRLAQLPQVETAFVALDPRNGAIRALVGGFDFNRNNFNHVTQAWRQPGSSFKPFIYSAGLERGITPATQINDAPLYVDPASVGGQVWEPKNYDGKFEGMMSLRTALTKSKNLVSIRVIQAITPSFAQAFISKFGFEAKNHPAYLTMALGAGSVTPLQMAEAYAVFANTGYRVPSYFIDRIEDGQGKLLARTQPVVAGESATRTLDERNAFIMTSLMQDVTRFGTAAKTNVLNRTDLAGKTGTTNDANDAWFAGFAPNVVAVSWVGFDQPKSLGAKETGGAAALPIWIDYMASTLKNVPMQNLTPPTGVVTQSIETARGTRDEYFLAEFLQTNPELALDNSGSSSEQIDEDVRDALF